MMISKHEPRVPEGVDVTRPSIARIYDYLLFGKDNFAADRAAADELMQSRLDPRRLALANRAFLRRAVRFAARQGISQFLDLGSGLPTSPSVHECAREVVPGSAALSTTRTCRPRRRNHNASSKPVGPAPTIKTSSASDAPMADSVIGLPWRRHAAIAAAQSRGGSRAGPPSRDV